MTSTKTFKRIANFAAVKKAFEATAQENKVLELAAMLRGVNSIDELMLEGTMKRVSTLVDQVLTLSEEVNENLTTYNTRILNILPLELSENVQNHIESYNTRVSNVLEGITTQEAANQAQYAMAA